MRWAEINIEAGPEARDAVEQVLRAVGCDGVVIRDTAAPPTVAGYLPVDDRLEKRLDDLQASLSGLSGFGIVGAGTELTLRYVEEDDWANAWKAYFKPLRVGRNLVVTPPWETPELGLDDVPIVVDPGMAFGTGSHPTTQLCLIALEDLVRPGMRVADVGTGSGILAIAAAKLGASYVIGTDIDPLAAQIARVNAGINGVDIHAQEELPSGAYDIVVANILADVIIGLKEELASLTAPDGLLIASGIIDVREEDVRVAIESVGFTLVKVQQQAEWVALILRRSAPTP